MYKKQNNSLDNTVKLQLQIATQAAEIAHLKQQLDRMTEILLNAQRAKFGQSSEKASYVLPGQENFFDEAESAENVKAPEPTEEATEVVAHKRKAKRPWSEIMKNLPVEEVVIELPDSQSICQKCDGTFRLIGKKFIRQEIIFIPQSLKILKYFSCTYACDRCEKETGYAHIVTTMAPNPLMKHSLASPSTVADVMTKKYVDDLPLYRQEKMWQREGVELSRATLSNWVIQCAQSWLKPLYRHMKETLLTSEVIYADETVVQVLKEDGKPATSESRMWVYGCDKRRGLPIRIFEYQKDRSGKHAEKFLNHFSGCLATDGYAGYNKVADV